MENRRETQKTAPNNLESKAPREQKSSEVYGPDHTLVESALNNRKGKELLTGVKSYVTRFFRTTNAQLDLLYTGGEANKYVAQSLRVKYDHFYSEVTGNEIINKDGKRFDNGEIVDTLRTKDGKALLERLTFWAMRNEARSVLSLQDSGVTKSIALAMTGKLSVTVTKERIEEARTQTQKLLSDGKAREKIVDEKWSELKDSGFDVRREVLRGEIISELSKRIDKYTLQISEIESKQQ